MPKVKAIYELKQEIINPDDCYMLSRALPQPPVKLKKQKPVFTKKEIEVLLMALKSEEQYLHLYCESTYEAYKSIKQKLNNQLKEMI